MCADLESLHDLLGSKSHRESDPGGRSVFLWCLRCNSCDLQYHSCRRSLGVHHNLHNCPWLRSNCNRHCEHRTSMCANLGSFHDLQGCTPTAQQILANGVVSCGACDATPVISGINLVGDHWVYTITCTTALGCTATATGRVNIERHVCR